MNTKKNNADKQNKEKDQPAATADEETSGRPVEGEPEGPIDSLEDLKQQLENQSDRYLRLMAEFDNFKKRVSRDYERLVESANEKLMGELIEVRENFERAIKTDEKCSDPTSIFEGMKLIFAKFNDVLTRNGLEPFAAAGEPFDPQLHDALMKVPSVDIPEDHVVEVFEKGYNLRKRVLRHAKVIVSSGMPDSKK
jgi:molecular chaperone GrpE